MTLHIYASIDTLTSKPTNYNLIATPEERKKIAQRLNLISIEKLEATLHLQKKDQLFLTGSILANVTQSCVRTLVPLPQQLNIGVDEIFILKVNEPEEEEEMELKDLIEPVQGNTLDLGEVVIQILSLNLDPYPVAPGSTPLDYQEKETKTSPFDVLKKKK